MTRWFSSLPLHRKLVAMALTVTAAALLVTVAGLIALDVWRYRVAAADDIRSWAQVVAANSAAALAFNDAEAAEQTLSTARVRPLVTRACIFLPTGELFAGYTRSTDRVCPARLRMPTAPAGWRFMDSLAPVTQNDRALGVIYAERDLSDLGTRIALTVGGGLFLLILAAGLAYVLAQRLHRTVSSPIVQLAQAARVAGPEQEYAIPTIATDPDEVGDLVRAFTGMVERVRESNRSLLQSNEALRREVEERRRVEAEREQLLLRERETSRIKDEFLAAVSHELRTPLNAILGWIQILATTETNPQTTKKAIESIARNARAQTRVIEDLVDVSRIVAGKLNLRLEPVDLRSIVDASVDAIRPAARAKHLSLDVRVPTVLCLINGDADRIQQVAWNLLSNAVKFTPDGGRISVALTDAGSAYDLTVSDTGIGISPEFLPYVFERFRQADGSMTREHGGLGLGLAIVKDLAELHGGSVTVASEGRGHGSVFTVRLPQLSGFEPRTLNPDVMLSIGTRPIASSLEGITVLAVDDNLDALNIMSSGLAAAGATVHVAASGSEALRSWKREPADVLVCDLAMPEMNGLDVIRRIRTLEAGPGHRTAAIAVSAYTSTDHIQQCLEAGFDTHLAKPYSMTSLIREVETLSGRLPGKILSRKVPS